jgi:N-acetylmuramoyl-L-alanine amidase/cell division protein ZapA (FtsZ GTPase activity inhibitor)
MATKLHPHDKGRVFYMDPETELVRLENKGAWLEVGKIQSTRPMIALDAGHGVKRGHTTKSGKTRYRNDYGADQYDVVESRITYDIAVMNANRFAIRGFDVIVTRNDNGKRGENLPQPPDGFSFRHQATKHPNIVLMVSLHANSFHNDKASGARIYSDSRNTSNAVSHDFRDFMIADGKTTPGRDIISDTAHRKRGYAMITPRKIKPSIPTILVEMAFMTNPDEYKNLTSTAWRRKFADELVGDAIAFYESAIAKKPQKTQLVDKEAGHQYPYYYIIQKGDNLSNIARQFGISLSELKGSNPEISDGRIYPDQELRIPNMLEYIVQEGDNASKIATQFKMSLKELGAANNSIKDIGKIHEGQSVMIPNFSIIEIEKGDSILAKLQQAYQENEAKVKYTVKAGDNLSTIAESFNVSLSDLKHSNQKTNNVILPKQILVIPQKTDKNKEDSYKNLPYKERQALAECVAGLNELKSAKNIHPGDDLVIPYNLESAHSVCDKTHKK